MMYYYKSQASPRLKVLLIFWLCSRIVFSLAAPSPGNGKPPIDWTCTTSPVRSNDPVQCFVEKPVAPKVRQGDPLIFEGDMAGVIQPGDTVASLNRKLKGVTRAGALRYARWWAGRIPCEIASTFTAAERAVILQAFKEFDRTDVVRFHQRTSEANYLSIFQGPGCWSYLGMSGGLQQLSLGSGCVYHGIIVHELNHALGFWHEQSRPDRDDYVELNFNNVPQDQQHNFNKYSSSEVTTSGTVYDFGSIMHYDTNDFGIQPDVWTIRPKAQYANYKIGQREKLSDTDIHEINALYPLCAILWFDPNFTNGEFRIVGGFEGNLPASSQDQYSSAMVTLGCTLTIYSLVNFQGEVRIMQPTQKGYVWYSFKGRSYDNSIRSLKCTCS